MLYEVIDTYRDVIIARTRERVRARLWPSVSSGELEHGVPLFLKQLSKTLRAESIAESPSSDAIGPSATQHGAELLAAGFTVAQVVHDYGDICQVVTELAVEEHAPITVEEFHTLNRCLDTAIAEAVTEHTRISITQRSEDDVERLGQAAHELRDLLNTALLAFHTLKRGAVSINGSTGGVLGRSLTSLRDFVDRILSEVRLAAGNDLRERLSVAMFIDDIASTALLHSEYRGVRFAVTPIDATLAVNGDQQLLTSAVMNLLHNAFKYTPPGGTVVLRAEGRGDRLVIEVADECGGIPDTTPNLFRRFGERRGRDRTGLGLGLFIARQAVRSHGGDIQVRNIPGQGCVFAIDLPLAGDAVSIPQTR
jgi:signal transduction histidine kinase